MSIACCFAGTIFLSTLKSGSYHLEEKVSFFVVVENYLPVIIKVRLFPTKIHATIAPPKDY